MAFSRLKADREFFTPEREAEFNRRAAESEREAANYPPAAPEPAHPEFDEVTFQHFRPNSRFESCSGHGGWEPRNTSAV